MDFPCYDRAQTRFPITLLSQNPHLPQIHPIPNPEFFISAISSYNLPIPSQKLGLIISTPGSRTKSLPESEKKWGA
jgi:hypothetical protein